MYAIRMLLLVCVTSIWYMSVGMALQLFTVSKAVGNTTTILGLCIFWRKLSNHLPIEDKSFKFSSRADLQIRAVCGNQFKYNLVHYLSMTLLCWTGWPPASSFDALWVSFRPSSTCRVWNQYLLTASPRSFHAKCFVFKYEKRTWKVKVHPA